MRTLTELAPHCNWDRLLQHKKTLTHIYKQHIHSVLEDPSLTGSTPYNNSLQHSSNYTEQCSMNHHWLYTNYTNKSSTLQKHRGWYKIVSTCERQFLDAASANPCHSCHYMLAHQPTAHSIKSTPQAPSPTLIYTSNLTSHNILAIQKHGPNTILGTPTPEIHYLDLALPSGDRGHLSRLCCRHHLVLAIYSKWIEDPIVKVNIWCNTNTNSLTHIMTYCPGLIHIRHNTKQPTRPVEFPDLLFVFPEGSRLSQPDKLQQCNNSNNYSTHI